MGARIAFLCVILLGTFTLGVQADENLKTPYVMLDPATQPPPSPVATPAPRLIVSPAAVPRFPADLGLPTVVTSRESSGAAELITVSNAAVALTARIGADGRVAIQSLKSNLTGAEFLAAPSPVFFLGGDARASSDAYKVSQWRGLQYPDYAELVMELRRRDAQTSGPESVSWRARAYRTRPQIEQEFELQAPGVVLGQVLETKRSLRPVMPANLFGRGFSTGKPNIPDRRRFEYTQESEHLCYDDADKTGLWGFVGNIGGQERIAAGRFALIQNPTFRTSETRHFGPFVVQPFHGPVEIGFVALRDFVQRHYSIQKDSPAAFEWNQFWLWMGGPTMVGNEVVTEKRLFDVLPLLVAMGLEEFHLDAGWERAHGDWTLDPERFPGGWEKIRDFNRNNGLAFHLWVNDPHTDSAEFILDLINKSGMNRLFMDRRVSEVTLAALEKVRASYPKLSVSVHNSTSRSAYWPWGNLHFLSELNQIYFGEGQFWAWSNIRPEQKIEARTDPLFPQLTEAERFFSKHDMSAGDLITRAAAYQAHWVWPFNSVMPPHSSWDWFEKRPIEQLKHRAITYLACKFKYEWGFDPRRLSPEALSFQRDCTAWFKANRDYLTVYQHVLDPPDGVGVDAVGHLIGQNGYVFVFNPSDREQQVEWKQILWEPELQLTGETVTLSDWTDLTSYKPLPAQNLSQPTGSVSIPAKGVKILGINLPSEDTLKRVQAERKKL